MSAAAPMLRYEHVGKTFTLHAQDGVRLPVLAGASLEVAAGDCVALTGPSGTGKSTLLRMAYGNYVCSQGRILVRHDGAEVDVARADARTILAMRRYTAGYVSQFLRVVPRVGTLETVAEPLRAQGAEAGAAREAAAALLARLSIPERLWGLSPLTFSGGEQQRVNIARGFVAGYPLLLLDEPTASLDAENRRAAMSLIAEARARGAAILGIFHDAEVRRAVCTRSVDVTTFRAAA